MVDIPDDQTTTIRLSAGSFIDSDVDDDDDLDFVRVELVAGQRYYFDLFGSSRSDSLTLTDPVLGLVDAALNVLALSDDNGFGLDARIAYTPTRSGTFYLVAASYATATYDGIGTYRLSMGTAGAALDDFGEGAGTAGTLSLDRPSSGTIDFTGDQDWFGVALTAGVTYGFSLTGNGGARNPLRDPVLSLFDANGEDFDVKIDENDDAGDTTLDSFLIFTPRTSGTYYLSAMEYDGALGSYLLTARVIASGKPAPNDFDGDGRSDILWRNTDGLISTWSAAGDGFGRNTYSASVGQRWSVVDTFDMDGDGRSDILWRDVDGTVAVWRANAPAGRTAFDQGWYLTGSPGAAWKIAATGDMDGDGGDDILWRNDDGSISAWRSTGRDFLQNAYFHTSVGRSWQVEGLADFDGDGRKDILWREDGGAISIWRSTGQGFAENSYFNAVDPSWRIQGLADLNGDGRDDILWRNDGGAVSTWRSTGTGIGFVANAYYNGGVGNDWRVAQLGDFNGDGAADLLWRNGGGAISVWRSNQAGFDPNTLNDPGAATSWQIQAYDFLL